MRKKKIPKLKIWFITLIIGGVGLMLFYVYFFTTLPNESELKIIKGTVEKQGISGSFRSRYKYIYLNEINNRFSESYLSMKHFRQTLQPGDSVLLGIKKNDLQRLNKNLEIKIWSLQVNHELFYSATQEINRQAFYKKYILPLLAIICIILVPISYKYQMNYYSKRLR